MSLIAGFHLSSSHLPLTDTVSAAPQTRVEVDKILTVAQDRPVIVCWVKATSFETFERTLAEDDGVTFRLVKLYEPTSKDHDHSDLTPKQRKALTIAYESDYFRIPRRVSLGDLSEQLGISKLSFSARLRRAQQRVIGNVVRANVETIFKSTLDVRQCLHALPCPLLTRGNIHEDDIAIDDHRAWLAAR